VSAVVVLSTKSREAYITSLRLAFGFASRSLTMAEVNETPPSFCRVSSEFAVDFFDKSEIWVESPLHILDGVMFFREAELSMGVRASSTM